MVLRRTKQGRYNFLMYYVYILKSRLDGSCYTGVTNDLKNRIEEHNSGSSRYSSTKRPYDLVWYCRFVEKDKAYEFEKYLKHGSGHAFARKHLIYFELRNVGLLLNFTRTKTTRFSVSKH